MEVRIYDSELNLVGIIESQTSLQWNRKYSETGNFEMHVPITSSNMNILKIGRIVSMRDKVDAGVIEDIRFYESEKKYEIVVKGRFLTSYMDRRLIRPTVNYSGKVELGMRKLITDLEYPIPNLELGELKGYDDEVTFQATYKNLHDYMQNLARGFALGIRFRPDFTAKKIYFEIYKGVDRSALQSELARVEFSDRYDNIFSAEYHVNSQIEKNVMYVGGEGEGAQRTFITVGDTSLTGLERKEGFKDARDLRSDDISQAQYIANLEERGRSELEKSVYSRAFECITNPRGNFGYVTNYDLGDIVTVGKESWGVEADLRIVRISEIYEHEIMDVNITFGSPLPEKIDWGE